MGAPLLTTASTIMCPHGGQAILLTKNARVTAGGPQVLLQSDTHMVVGCSFTIGTKYSPCVRIQWSTGATRASIRGQPPLTQTSVGTCYSGEGAPQGVAVIASTQPRARAT